MQEKTIKQLQQEVDEYISQFKEGYFSPLAMLARLTEELGELAREVNHYYGEKPKKQTEKEKTIEEELGDLLFAVVNITRYLKIDAEASLRAANRKFEQRFQYMEQHSARPLAESSMDEMNRLWDEAKKTN